MINDGKVTYYLVIHDNKGNKGVSAALKSIVSESKAKILLRDENPVITRKENGGQYRVTDKKYFEYVNTDGTKTLFIVCNADKI